MREKEIFHGHVFDVIQKEVEIDGRECIRDLVVHHGGVALSCVKDHQILLVRQTRTAADAITLEIPAGTIEPHEKPDVTGLRELNEEAGLTCEKMNLITAFWPTPGYSTEVIYVYECLGLSEVNQRRPLDEGEDITSLWMDLDEAKRAIEQGSIRDGKTIIAIYHALLKEKDH
ncbi:NUDIX hydrolase [Ileibacterium valens]|uniref:Nudix hydrolase domain-containing protein n=1 Tax=Ileibacterium valens TaxID=1862668 RepID=A0A1U7NDQ0_9FIRM|nr:NUDIX hydrolase [Ileibacterium valens]OLU37471.1 hypothetical protein BO222_10685 [Ileibacterium valens]OLU39261.1 hypothetical protein BO224_07690 [Erysipelotrichaceae bacterium NYU-BL-E8]OLU42298.1 hypothetical protein BM735_02640 [Erysipelotrichaceae bacterium NYU-BL-F16]